MCRLVDGHAAAAGGADTAFSGNGRAAGGIRRPTVGAGCQRHGAFIVHADFTVCPIDLENAVWDCHLLRGSQAAPLRDRHFGALAGLRLRGHADIGVLVQIAVDDDAFARTGQIEVVVLLAFFVAGDLGAALDHYNALCPPVAAACVRVYAAAIPHRGVADDLAAFHSKAAVIAIIIWAVVPVKYIQIYTAAASAGVVAGDLGISG